MGLCALWMVEVEVVGHETKGEAQTRDVRDATVFLIDRGKQAVCMQLLQVHTSSQAIAV